MYADCSMQRKGNLAHLWMILLRSRRAETTQGWITPAGLRKEAAHQGGLRKSPHGEDVRCGAHMRVVLAHRFVDVIERAIHHHLEPAVHFVFLPEVALQVLRPLEVANGQATRVGQDIW